MGLYFGRSRSSADTIDPPALPNPNPKNYEIVRYEQVNDHLAIEIRYPDCTNYEGRKVMVYRNVDLDQLRAQGAIDPHFANNPKFISPFARFEPTDKGWYEAVCLARHL